MITCTQCGTKNPDDAEFCENCGAQLPVAVAAVPVSASAASSSGGSGGVATAPAPAVDNLVCPNCKAPYTEGDVFCFNCGFDLTKLPSVKVAPSSSAAAPTPAKPLTQPAPPPAQQSAPPAPPAQNSAPSQQPPDISLDDFDKALSGGSSLPNPPAQQSAPPAQASAPMQPPPAPPASSSSSADPFAAPSSPSSNGNAFAAPTTTSPSASSAPASNSTPTMLKLNIVGPSGTQTVEYQGHEILLGRRDVKTRVFPDVSLDDGGSSRRHLGIYKDPDDGQFYGQDLETTNGTLLNNQMMPPGDPVLLQDKDIIRIGEYYSVEVRIS